MNKKIGKVIIAIILILIIILVVVYLKSKNSNKIASTDLNVVLSLEDKISENTTWCGTFNLIWNDLKNDLVKRDIEFTPRLDIVKNLNIGTFDTSYISEDSYYKVYGTPSLELKKQIEKAIHDKFNETSDILDDFNWDGMESQDYLLYAMLKKEFEFPNVFTELENDKFGNCDNVKYFGINSNTDKQVRTQVQVLYYNSKDDFAIKLLTKGNDEVIIERGSTKDSFKSSYDDIMIKNSRFNGNQSFANIDTLKIPNISFNLKKEIKEIEDKEFLSSDGDIYVIEKALQTIQFELNKKGGKIKSEAGIRVEKMSVDSLETPREFVVDDTFTIFLKEKDKELPYFAAKISDITKVQ